ncbi:scarecrow-like protein 3 [Diospyros lotus]|uniref:scarecrow-like protein 3 n=1 Tax=Diospyros lotus TaxID=55363 RepID=UPI0022570CB0|nr:scarecrow-like protein 3 [Diospyros lotus]
MGQEDGSSSVSSSPLQLFSLMSLSPGLGSPYPWHPGMKSEERGLCLIKLLVNCANHIAAGCFDKANATLEQISHLASAEGDAMQRIAAYFTEALANRMLKGWPGLHKALSATKISSVSEEILVQRWFFDLCPFLRCAYFITNFAIIEAMEGEKVVHIVDLNSSEPAQWIDLLHALRHRPQGPPHLKITGIHQQKEVLELMGHRLSEEAEKLDLPFQFNPIVSKLENLDMDLLRVKTGEAVAVISVLQLHSLLASEDEMVRRNSPSMPKSSNSLHLQSLLKMNSLTLRDFLVKDVANLCSPSPDSASPLSTLYYASSPNMINFLNGLRQLSPKLVMVMEQESDHNGHSLVDRVTEALNFYGALFDGLQSTVSRASVERYKVEKMLFGEEIKNIIACEGFERKERHEKLERWIPRLEFAGFGRVPLSYHSMLQATGLLQTLGYGGYNIEEEKRCAIFRWHNKPLFSISAWRFGKYS